MVNTVREARVWEQCTKKEAITEEEIGPGLSTSHSWKRFQEDSYCLNEEAAKWPSRESTTSSL